MTEPIVVVGVGTPEVKARLETIEAPVKAALCMVAVGLGMAIVLLGFSTLHGSSAGFLIDASGVILLVNHMHDAVGDKHVGSNDFGAVDEDITVLNLDGEVCAVHGLKHHAVHEGRAVSHSAIDDWLSSQP